MTKGRGPALAAAILLLATVLTGCGGLPRLEDYPTLSLAQTSFLYASDGSLITELHADQDRVVLTFGQIPQSIRDATVAIEDRRFYQHHGVDLRAILRAAYDNVAAGRTIEGGSTITEQLVKNLYTGAERTLRRKLDEAVLAWQLEDRMTKDQILTEYLNTVYFGAGAYGVQAAARTFFGVDAADLGLAQSATLAGLITSPGHFDPVRHPRRALGRRDVVLRLMFEQHLISSRAYARSIRANLNVRRSRPNSARYPYPYFVDYFKAWFLSNPAFGETREDRYKALFTGGLRITTTLDPRLQSAAESAVRSVLSYPSDPAGAMTVMDPTTGYVRAMVGGRTGDYWDGTPGARVNLATGEGGTGRQSGSSFKPFALVAAIENGISPSTVFSAPSSIQIPMEGGHVWSVTNAEGSGYGSLSLADATIHSVNTVYAQLIDRVGAAKVVAVAKRMGIRCCTHVSQPTHPLLPYLSAVLGTNEVNTLEMADAYSTLASGGSRVDPVPVLSVTDAKGNVLWRADPRPRRMLDPQIASVVDQILQNVVLYGTGTAANIGRPQIGKTGTAMDHSNAWFVGAIPQLTAAVWVGYPRGQIPMVPPRTRITVFGGTWPAGIWRVFMERAALNLPVRTFPQPAIGYVSVAVDTTQQPYCLPNQYTLPQNVQTLQFVAGMQPRKTCTTPTSLQSITVPSVIGLPQAAAEETLRQAGFSVTATVAPSTQPAGTVVYQNPAAGVDAYQTSTVTITVSSA
ncbi:MAG: transglycosylase domain-containing protein [Actinomycetota bacterium]|nr:transglycosylase domain-containing protein [Actinomycetota bacterium]